MRVLLLLLFYSFVVAHFHFQSISSCLTVFLTAKIIIPVLWHRILSEALFHLSKSVLRCSSSGVVFFWGVFGWFFCCFFFFFWGGGFCVTCGWQLNIHPSGQRTRLFESLVLMCCWTPCERTRHVLDNWLFAEIYSSGLGGCSLYC